jgi:anti-anti-sigma factor
MAAMAENLHGSALRHRGYGGGLPETRPGPLRPAAPLTLELHEAAAGAGALHVVAAGEIDASNAGWLRQLVAATCAARATRTLILDVAGVQFIDSSALRVLLRVDRELGRAGGGLVLLAPTRQVRGLLEMTGLDRRLAIVESLTESTP